jgi:protease-4
VRRALLSAAGLALAVAVACTPRPRSSGTGSAEASKPGSGEKRVIEVDLSGGAPEALSGGLFQMPATRTYTGLIRALERGLDAETTSAVLVRLGTQSFELAQAEELGGLLARFGKKNIPVICHADGLSNATAGLVLRGCSKRWLAAAGDAETVGIAAQVVYLKGLFDKLKVQADFLHVGRFKSGPEPLTQEGPSPEAREALEFCLGSVRQSWLELASGAPESVRDALERGPWSPAEAKTQGLVHELGYESDARIDAEKLGKTTARETVFGPQANKQGDFDFTEIVRVLAGSGDSENQPHVAVVPAEGSITTDGGGAFGSSGITSKAMSKTLRRLGKNDSVKAVVIRIDSPGGSPLASDLIWHELMELRKKKPVIASVGGMAASGGYYIVAGTQRIFAEPTSIVGSIGVFGGKIVLGAALKDVGVNSVTFPANKAPGAAERATYLSPFEPWDDASRERMRAVMQGIYDVFIQRVSEGRKMPADKVLASAEGRIWSATQGLERGLVDEIGGLSQAIAHARKLASLEADAPVTVEGGADGLLELLNLEEGADEASVKRAFERLAERRMLSLEALPVELRPFAASLAPLFAGEHVVAALPYALTVR